MLVTKSFEGWGEGKAEDKLIRNVYQRAISVHTSTVCINANGTLKGISEF